MNRRPKAAFAIPFVGICIIYLAFATATIATKRPWVDEGWFTGPGLDLVTRGKFGTLLLDPAGSFLRLYKPDAVLRGIDQHTYWVMPLYLLQIALWGKIVGFTVVSVRIPSALWGIVTLGSIAVLIRRLYPPGGSLAALTGSAVLAVDFGFIEGASDARMDMMCSALGFASLAVYLSLRDRYFYRAILLAHTLAAAACFTHPYGASAVVALLVVMVWMDRNQLRAKTLSLIAIPYLIGLLGWAIYCAHAPADFMAQFSANAASKMERGPVSLDGIWLEITHRYRMHYWPETAFGKMKAVGLILALGAMVSLALVRTLRQVTGCRLLICLVILEFLILAFSGGPKFEYYLVQIVPYFAAMIGIAIGYFWSTRSRRWRAACIIALISYGGIETAVLAHKVILVRGYQNEYLPLISYLESNVRGDDLVAGSAELGFGLGFYNPRLEDDVWLGYWSGRQPTVVVVDQWYYEGAIDSAIKKGLPTPGYFTNLFGRDFALIKELKGYKIYRRRNASTTARVESPALAH